MRNYCFTNKTARFEKERKRERKKEKENFKSLFLPYSPTPFLPFSLSHLLSFYVFLRPGILILLFCSTFFAQQKLAFLNPEKTSLNQIVGENLKAALSKEFKILDDSMAETAARSFSDINIYNLSTDEARNLGAAIGCDFFIVGKSETLRRASLYKSDYYESYAALYLVSARTGRLVFWKLLTFEAENPAEAEKQLLASMENPAAEISVKLKSSAQTEPNEAPPKLPELPADNSPEAKNFRSPLPYRRIKPEYTNLANLYGVAATVDALIDLDEDGKISRIEIVRWAGYGLDEAVAETIRKMQWRAAERDGRTLPIRVLLRYNFKKINNEDDEND
jgi:hypothetical protein